MYKSRRVSLWTAAAALIAVIPATAHAEPLRETPGAVPGQYIVTLTAGTAPSAVLNKLRVKPLYVYGHALPGFAAKFTAAQLAKVRGAAGVDEVEQDTVVTIPEGEDAPSDNDLEPPDLPEAAAPAAPTQVPEAPAKTPATPAAPAAPAGSAAPVTPPAASPGAQQSRRSLGGFVPWGLTRINHRTLDGIGYSVKATGAKVTSYIIDTGIEYSHPDFGGRAVPGYDAINDGHNGADCNGHGTHVAGTVGGSYTGVARKTRLVSVRVFPCASRTTNSALIAGIDWVAGHAAKPAVANISVAGRWSLAANRAVEGLSKAGVFPVVAAGNDNINACFVSPASSPQAFAVGAIDETDHRAWFSNWGPCVDIHAPGTDILSSFLNGTFRTMDGTAMAAPHVAGIAALYKDTYGDTDFATLSKWLSGNATRNVPLDGGYGTARLFAYTNGL
ncbi:S8 family peptidase [Streptomyces sp. NPDC059373]